VSALQALVIANIQYTTNDHLKAISKRDIIFRPVSLQSNPAHKGKVVGSSERDDVVYCIVENSNWPANVVSGCREFRRPHTSNT